MAGEPTETRSIPSPPRPAVWPWLLIPLVALALFFALRSVREATTQPAPEAMGATPAAVDETVPAPAD